MRLGRVATTASGSCFLKLVFLTGATGFVGAELVRVLQSNGYEVHALARANSDKRIDGSENVRWHAGDLTQPTSMKAAISLAAKRATELNTELLAIHNAAVISYRTADRDLQQRVNVEGTRDFLTACRTLGVRRVVHVSSVVAVGTAASVFDELDEGASFNGAGQRCDYTDTKRAGEELALRMATDMEVVVVNPGAIYGTARVLSNTSKLLKLLNQKPSTGLFAPPGSVSCVGVSDVAEGIVLALERGQSGRRYILTESNLRWQELYSSAAELNQSSVRTRTLPDLVWRSIAAGATAVDKIRPCTFATPQALRLLRLHYRFSSTRARSELGWSPRPFDEVLRETVLWLADSDPS